MPVFIDTAMVWAALERRQSLHDAAREELRMLGTGREGRLLSSDYVYAECQSLARKAGSSAVTRVDNFFFGPAAPLTPMRVDPRAFDEARARMLAHPAAPLSFVDWTTLVLARRYRCARIATYDRALERTFSDPTF